MKPQPTPILLEQIRLAMAHFGDDLQPACMPTEIKTFKSKFAASFHCSPATAYLQLLSISDGLRYNGVQVYGSKRRKSVNSSSTTIEGIFSANRWIRKDRRDAFDDLVVYGRGDMDLFVYDVPAKLFRLRSHGGDDLEEHPTFESLMARAFRGRLP